MPSKNNEEPIPSEVASQRLPRFDVALLVALLPVLGAAIRIWMYSGGDSAVFLVLLRTLNLPAVLIGTCVFLVPIIFILAIVVLLTDWKARDWIKDWLPQHRWIAPLFPITFFVLLYTASWTILITVLVLGLLVIGYFLIKRFWGWGHHHLNNLVVAPRGDQNGPASILTVISVIVVFLITPSNMWLPLERIETTNGDAQVAYVLESTSEWSTLLTPQRRLEVIMTSDIESRTICRTTGGGSLATLLYPSDLGDAPSCEL